MTHDYPASYAFDDESDAWHITFRDFPQQQAACYSRDDIELEAQESLLIAIASEMAERRPLPPASAPRPDEIAIHLPVLVTLKLELHNIMLAQTTSKADLARKLGYNAAQIDRLLDIGYASKVEALEQALYLLGHEIRLTVNAINGK
ncbi:hypothetical protein [Serratia sp. AKBS12]|uniref:hypothetical protein n=1 Tax=Serratia sp. AKBS12 TaxID=2974597 RepID=UPI0021665509|nr:hypothetical protein [Serratia sp. AKBS12]MCS3407756.1 hypothetical protein [Serratia sp. AKBS12]HEI8866550.1 hypothetical protein [Serratia odorifera]